MRIEILNEANHLAKEIADTERQWVNSNPENLNTGEKLVLRFESTDGRGDTTHVLLTNYVDIEAAMNYIKTLNTERLKKLREEFEKL